jgi:hypothetical protein
MPLKAAHFEALEALLRKRKGDRGDGSFIGMTPKVIRAFEPFAPLLLLLLLSLLLLRISFKLDRGSPF